MYQKLVLETSTTQYMDGVQGMCGVWGIYGVRGIYGVYGINDSEQINGVQVSKAFIRDEYNMENEWGL